MSGWFFGGFFFQSSNTCGNVYCREVVAINVYHDHQERAGQRRIMADCIICLFKAPDLVFYPRLLRYWMYVFHCQ